MLDLKEKEAVTEDLSPDATYTDSPAYIQTRPGKEQSKQEDLKYTRITGLTRLINETRMEKINKSNGNQQTGNDTSII